MHFMVNYYFRLFLTQIVASNLSQFYGTGSDCYTHNILWYELNNNSNIKEYYYIIIIIIL